MGKDSKLQAIDDEGVSGQYEGGSLNQNQQGPESHTIDGVSRGESFDYDYIQTVDDTPTQSHYKNGSKYFLGALIGLVLGGMAGAGSGALGAFLQSSEAKIIPGAAGSALTFAAAGAIALPAHQYGLRLPYFDATAARTLAFSLLNMAGLTIGSLIFDQPLPEARGFVCSEVTAAAFLTFFIAIGTGVLIASSKPHRLVNSREMDVRHGIN